jgi:transposase
MEPLLTLFVLRRIACGETLECAAEVDRMNIAQSVGDTLQPDSVAGRLPDRRCLIGILFVLRSGIPWGMVPQEPGYGSGMTCWRRLRDWQEAGIWQLIRFVALDLLARRRETSNR